jgi:hypothetical protein
VSKSPTITEADILDEVVAPDQPGLSPDVARSILELKFSKRATRRIRQLLRRNNLGTISAQERVTLEKYLRVGQFLDIWQAKAKLSLKQSEDAR